MSYIVILISNFETGKETVDEVDKYLAVVASDIEDIAECKRLAKKVNIKESFEKCIDLCS